ncbi:Crp/Fnr family transcriptional regulator [Oharaeibacter diazotrophicus]|uniref:CRP-like cAMP-binding protein n=1 Tax=Oharaeibacter diazotrophicus TaxID=1920512 RepID=A0A4R6RJ99_9HYPH|nr:Crp/Fnr family transcriptional regulator [Oharaeibacter diazotrophicus]TDP86593.1 CRP-like cAMP-binding protein [Oharaeibacter diazotrophicus]BBE71465.1 cAMP receptor protein [Pleomorphomonas sp. SM30]GLS78225.1 transcriptional regulator [Oharaeibacter diazotrophicus]
MTPLADILAADALFAALTPDDRAAVAALARRRGHPAGTVLFQRGDPGRDMLVVAAGRIRLSVLSPEGRELSLRHAGPGSLIGEIAVLDGGPRSADATAVTDVELWSVARADLDRLIAARPHVARVFVDVLCAKLRDTTEQLETVALYRLEARLARFLLGLAKGLPVEAGKARLELPFNQSEIADVIGASRPKVNRAFAELEAAGAIERVPGGLICRPGRLAAVAEGEEG